MKDTCTVHQRATTGSDIMKSEKENIKEDTVNQELLISKRQHGQEPMGTLLIQRNSI